VRESDRPEEQVTEESNEPERKKHSLQKCRKDPRCSRCREQRCSASKLHHPPDDERHRDQRPCRRPAKPERAPRHQLPYHTKEVGQENLRMPRSPKSKSERENQILLDR